jgi:predicted AAA+ superfamily ATPase
MSERRKTSHYHDLWANSWFWRTTQQAEIDLVEEADGHLTAYEFKWNPQAKTKKHRLFLDTYAGSKLAIVHRDNIEQFLIPTTHQGE